MRSPRGSFLRIPATVALLAGLLVMAGPDADDLRIQGRVTDATDGRALQGAQVYVQGTGLGALTGSDGRYDLRVPAEALPSRPVLVVELIGYAREERPLPDGAATRDALTVDVRLSAEALTLDALVVGQGATQEAARARMAPTAFDDAARIARPAVPIAPHGPPPPGWNREQYAHVEENGFRRPVDAPLSTFSIDVDRASYSNVRRFLLREGRLPPVDAVRIEELVNYFSYEYDRPRGGHPVAVTTELGSAPWAPAHRLLRVGIASQPVEVEELPPANLVFLLDVSGSMSSPDKLPLVQSSMRLLVDRMRPQDRVAIVVYAGAAGLVLEPTSGEDKERILEAIERLRAGGSTAGGAGLRLAYDVARRAFRPEGNNRVILATDGDFNVGESSDAAMIRLVEERREEGTYLTVLGFGTGNLQSAKMESIAQHGNGNYAYIDGMAEARKVLVGEMGGTLLTVAKDVKVQVEFNPERVAAYRLLGYENRLLAAEDFNDDAKDAGELGAGHTVTALYEIVPVGVDSGVLPPEVDPLRYGGAERTGRSRTGAGASGSRELAFVKVRYKRPSGGASRLLTHPVDDAVGRPSTDLTFASAVAGFGMLLRNSEHRGSVGVEQILTLARAGLGEDADGYRRGFLELVERYRWLDRGHGEPTRR